MKIQNRLKSKVVWISILSFVAFVVMQVSGININEQLQTGLNIVLPALVGLGILNNPTEKDKF